MIETKTLNRLAQEFVRFANGEEPFVTEAAAQELAALRIRVQQCCKQAAEWKPENHDGELEEKLQITAEKWLDDWSGRKSRPAYPFVSMEAAWSLTADGRLELTVARFGSLTAQMAVTFAALVQDDRLMPKKKRHKWRPLIRRCRLCETYFVIEVPRSQAAPRIYCDPHYEEAKRKKKQLKVRTPI